MEVVLDAMEENDMVEELLNVDEDVCEPVDAVRWREVASGLLLWTELAVVGVGVVSFEIPVGGLELGGTNWT
jgi:hypothetical protein